MSQSSSRMARHDLAEDAGSADKQPPAAEVVATLPAAKKSAARRRPRVAEPTVDAAATSRPRPRRKPEPDADQAPDAAAGAESSPAAAKAPTRSAASKSTQAAGRKAAPKKAVAKKRPARKKSAAPVEGQAPQEVAEPAQAVAEQPQAVAEPAAGAAATIMPQPTAPVAAEPALPPAPPLVQTPSRLELHVDDAASVVWHPAVDCPDALASAALEAVDQAGRFDADDDEAIARLMRTAAACGHKIEADARIWPHLAARRDAKRRLAALQLAYPDGAADAGLERLLHVALAPFQAEGALWAVVAGRALLADERGLGKSVQAIAAARLWQRHFGLRHVLVVCAPAQCALWRCAWQRLAGIEAVMLGRYEDARAPTPQAREAEVRIVAPEALAAGAAALAGWAPQLVIVDEPQRLALSEADWAAIDAPQMLVLSGAAFDAQPALLDALVQRLDCHRIGALAALREVTAARAQAQALSEAEIERLDAPLSRLLLQRQRADVAAELPVRIWCERVLVLAPTQRAAHERARRRALALLAGWRACGWLALADQWPLADAVRTMRSACHRDDPGDDASALADATVAALEAQLADWAADGVGLVALCCASATDRDRLAERLGERPGLCWVIRGEAVPAAAEAVLLAGALWSEDDIADEAGTPRGRPWTAVIAADSFDSGLFETLALRRGVPAGPGPTGWLEGEALQAWLQAIDAALRATADGPAAVRGGSD